MVKKIKASESKAKALGNLAQKAYNVGSIDTVNVMLDIIARAALAPPGDPVDVRVPEHMEEAITPRVVEAVSAMMAGDQRLAAQVKRVMAGEAEVVDGGAA